MRNNFYWIGVILLTQWLVYFVDAAIIANLTHWGLQPRSWAGLVGIPLMPFLHNGFGHLFGNTIPLFVLLALLTGSRTNQWKIVISIALLNGILLWLFGRNAVHVGASGLVFGLISFLIVSGLMEKRPIPMAISVLVGLLYGGTLIWGVIPRIDSCSTASGAVFAAVYLHD